ncbi:Type-2 restriction enzyme BsuMI component YdjA [Bacillus subtilis]|uniref:LlaJI family restriction endonuclease n=1 Tax=Bacillus subtilis TaxID=1423 RepID=UPI001B9717B4|nr:LlaJI family restriction endonuclease [Bacillus subtilis]CAF1907199.1 Type-2 restriction enzyme BsuMI component YdjA [Bacillus subtilis]CAI6231992.1 Type-2 restriction enzyme BsuMI component YdjA [Bacillus subtilis]
MDKSSKFFFEDQKYNKERIVRVLGGNLALLKSKGILYEDSSGDLIFNYVGVISNGRNVIFILPKYCNRHLDEHSKRTLFNKLLKIFKKYSGLNKSRESDYFVSELDSDEVSDFMIADYLLNDFSLNGYYQKKFTEYEIDGEGIIDWSKTVNEITPVFSNGVPYYFSTYNEVVQKDEYHLIVKIHKWALSKYFNDFGVILGFTGLEFDKSCDGMKILDYADFFGSVINKEIVNTYVDRDVKLLKALKTAIDREENQFSKRPTLSLYGTKYFHRVWEEVCKTVFSHVNEYVKKISRPNWINFTDIEVNKEKKTLEPDIIKAFEYRSKEYFLILDAKYYNINFDGKKLEGNPGVEDITKQLLYDKALEKLSRGKTKHNAFLFPSSNSTNTFKVFGSVDFDFLDIAAVTLVYISAEQVYNLYLENKTFSTDDLFKFVSEINKSKKRHSVITSTLYGNMFLFTKRLSDKN